jgi:hypothetical protein
MDLLMIFRAKTMPGRNTYVMHLRVLKELPFRGDAVPFIETLMLHSTIKADQLGELSVMRIKACH